MRRVLLGVMCAVLLGGCSSSAIPQQSSPSPSSPTTPVIQRVETPRQVNRQPVIPQRLYGWRVIDAPVVKLHLQGDTLVPPSDPRVLGWWGAKAGASRGTTLLVGHTVHDGGGALDNLEDVPLGSTLRVSGVRYTVTSNRVISKAKLAAEAQRLFSPASKPRLVVVTCENYHPATGHYSSNVVLIAE